MSESELLIVLEVIADEYGKQRYGCWTLVGCYVGKELTTADVFICISSSCMYHAHEQAIAQTRGIMRAFATKVLEDPHRDMPSCFTARDVSSCLRHEWLRSIVILYVGMS